MCAFVLVVCVVNFHLPDATMTDSCQHCGQTGFKVFNK